MSARTKTPVYLAIPLLLGSLLSISLPAAGAGGGVKIDLRIHGGYSYLKADDVNTGSGGLVGFYKTVAELAPEYAFEGGYESLHAGYDVGVDAVFLLSPRFGIGLGAGYLRSSGKIDGILTIDTSEIVFEGGPILSAVPIRLGLFVTQPLAGRLSLTANAGAAYYAGLTFHDFYRYDASPVVWGEQKINASRWNPVGNLGFQGGLGLDYRISPKMGLFVEAQGRYARFKNFDKAEVTVASAEGGQQTREGKIYLVTQVLSADPFIAITSFQVAGTPISPNPPDYLVREPKFDFSGYCLQMGVRIRL